MNEDIQVIPMPRQSFPPLSAPPSEKADIIDKIQPEKIVEIIRNKLMGKDFINGAWVDIPSLQGRALNDTGAWDISNLLLSVASQNVALSKLTDGEIRLRTLEVVKTAQKMLLRNWKEYQIKGTDQLAYVHQLVMGITLITLKQCQDGGIRDLIKNTRMENINTTNSEGKRWNLFGRGRP